jgi:hypothetical protein
MRRANALKAEARPPVSTTRPSRQSAPADHRTATGRVPLARVIISAAEDDLRKMSWSEHSTRRGQVCHASSWQVMKRGAGQVCNASSQQREALLVAVACSSAPRASALNPGVLGGEMARFTLHETLSERHLWRSARRAGAQAGRERM